MIKLMEIGTLLNCWRTCPDNLSPAYTGYVLFSLCSNVRDGIWLVLKLKVSLIKELAMSHSSNCGLKNSIFLGWFLLSHVAPGGLPGMRSAATCTRGTVDAKKYYVN